VGALGSPSGAALTTGKVKKVARKAARKQIKKLVPGMIDAATIDQGTIPVVTASTTDPNKPIFTKGPFTLSLDCSDDGGDVNLKLLVRTTEENSVVNASQYVTGDLDPADGDQIFDSYLGNPPGGEAQPDYPTNQMAFLRSPSGTNVYVQFDSVTNFKGNHCYLDGWFLDLAGAAPSSASPKSVAGASQPAPSAPLSTGKVKKVAKRVATKQINKLVPGMIDAATLDQGTIPPVTASIADPNKAVFTRGPFTISLDCSLDGGNVELTLLVRTSEENSVVNASLYTGGDLDPADGDQVLKSYDGNPPGGDAVIGDPFDEYASFRSPSGTHVEVHLDSVTNFQGNHCTVDGWFVDLTGAAPSGGTAAKVEAARSRPVLSPSLTTGRVKKIATKAAKKQIKKLVPGMIDAATIDQGTIPPVTASIADPNKAVFTRGPFTISLDCSLETGTVDLTMLARTTEENSVVSSGWGYLEEVDPADGDVLWAEGNGNAPGGDAHTGSDLGYQVAVFRSPSGAHFYAQFDAVTNYQGNHCFVDGWILDLAG
jgi:hypothetical protein